MDLNVGSYNTEELLEALGVEAPKDQITSKSLRECLDRKLYKIGNVDEGDLNDSKKDLVLFFQSAFLRLMATLELHREREFISVKEGLLPSLEPTNPVQQGGSVVAQHVSYSPVNTFPSTVAPGIINPLMRKAYKKLVNINTKFRKDYQTTPSTDFQIELPYPVKKVVSMKLQNHEFPKTVYTFAKSLGSNYFYINDFGMHSTVNGWQVIEVPDGSYPPQVLAQAITHLLTTKGYQVALTIDPNNGKSTLKSPDLFDLDFDYRPERCGNPPSNINRNQLTLGWLLGFRGDAIKTPQAKLASDKPRNEWIQWSSKCCAPPYEYPPGDPQNKYTGEKTYISEGLFSGHGTPYFLLLVDDFHNNHSDVIISPFKDQSVVDNTVLAKIPTDCCVGGCACGPERIYFGPVELRRLRIRLLDEYGREVEINNADYSLTLELEVVYDL